MILTINEVIIQSQFSFSILRVFRSKGGQNFSFPIDFAGYRYNSAATTMHPVMISFHSYTLLNMEQVGLSSINILGPDLQKILRLY